MTARPDYAPLLSPATPPKGVDPDAHAVALLAAANGWQYFTHAAAQPLPGVVFRETDGSARFMQVAANIVRLPGSPSIEIGNTVYIEIAAGNQFAQQWGYSAVELGVPLPTVVIEAARNRRISALPSLPAQSTPLTRGAAGREVTIYAEPAAAAWAAELFPPEVLALLDDGVLAFNVELAGSYVFLYSPGRLATPDPAVWERVLAATSAVVARLQAEGTGAASTGSAAPVRSERPEDAPRAAAAAPLPQSHAPQAPTRPVMRTNGWAVNGRRVLWQWGIVIGSMALIGAGFFLFGAR